MIDIHVLISSSHRLCEVLGVISPFSREGSWGAGSPSQSKGETGLDFPGSGARERSPPWLQGWASYYLLFSATRWKGGRGQRPVSVPILLPSRNHSLITAPSSAVLVTVLGERELTEPSSLFLILVHISREVCLALTTWPKGLWADHTVRHSLRANSCIAQTSVCWKHIQNSLISVQEVSNYRAVQKKKKKVKEERKKNESINFIALASELKGYRLTKNSYSAS